MNNLTKQENGFALKPQNMQEAMQFASMLANSSMIPKNFQGKDGDTLVAMMMGSELGLNPIQALQNIAVINGRPSLWGDAMIALVQNHPKFGGIKESFDDATMTATCVIWRKGGDKHTVRYSQADATLAGLWGKQGPWKQYPKRMLQLRARGFGLRDQFADALSGLISAEEAQDMPENTDNQSASTLQPAPTAKYYSKEDFDKNFSKWKLFIEAGKKTASDLINMIETKSPLTDEMKKQILAIKKES